MIQTGNYNLLNGPKVYKDSQGRENICYCIEVNSEGDMAKTYSLINEAMEGNHALEGVITAVGGGITVVSARTENSYVHIGVDVKGNKEYVDKDGNIIEVFDGASDITEIEVGVKTSSAKGDITVKVGDSVALRAYTTPSDSKDKIVWRTADASIASVNEKGEMRAIGKGKTEITAYAPNGVKGKLIVRVK